MENRQENCGGCAYRKKWFCPIIGGVFRLLKWLVLKVWHKVKK